MISPNNPIDDAFFMRLRFVLSCGVSVVLMSTISSKLLTKYQNNIAFKLNRSRRYDYYPFQCRDYSQSSTGQLMTLFRDM